MSTNDELFNDIVERDLFVELVADGVSEVNAGFEVGWTPAQTRRNMADPVFREVVDAARDRADGTMEKAMFDLGTKGKNLGAMQMWLYNRRPDRWKDVRRIEVKNETTINLGVVQSTKVAVMELLKERGALALQPAYDDIIDAEILDDDPTEAPPTDG